MASTPSSSSSGGEHSSPLIPAPPPPPLPLLGHHPQSHPQQLGRPESPFPPHPPPPHHQSWQGDHSGMNGGPPNGMQHHNNYIDNRSPMLQGQPGNLGPPPPVLRSSSWPHGGHGPLQDSRTQLFVSNLPFRVRWQDLKDLMRKCGTVLRADVALTPSDGRSRGFGVVLFSRAEDAHKAIEVYHGYSWQTRILDVRVDSQDPRGELALAEANRQTAMQQQQERYQLAMQQGGGVPPQMQMQMMGMGMGMGGGGGGGGGGGMGWQGGMPPQMGGQMGMPQPFPHQQQQQQHPPQQMYPPPPPPPQSTNSHGSSSMPPSVVYPSSTGLGGAGSSTSSPRLAPATSVPASNSSSTASPRLSAATATSTHTASPRLSHSHSSTPPLHDSKEERSDSPDPSRIGRSEGFRATSGSRSGSMDGRGVTPNGDRSSGGGSGYGYGMNGGGGGGGVPPPPPPPPSMMMMMGGSGGGGGAGQHFGGGPQGTMHGGLMNYYQQQQGQGQQRVGPSPVPAQYVGRHLFVGNLPFNCQWQELKDLMRQCGSVLRADIAQGPDGRSRGFGSVLFATSSDAERAVQQLNNYEFNGRVLKVHFDKFSTATGGQSPPPPSSAYGGGAGQHPMGYPMSGGQGGYGGEQRGGGGAPPMMMPWQQPAHLQHFQHQQHQHHHQQQQQQHAQGNLGPAPLQDRQPLRSISGSSEQQAYEDGEEGVEGQGEERSGVEGGAEGATVSKGEPHSEQKWAGEGQPSSSTTVDHGGAGKLHISMPSRISMPPPYPFGMHSGMTPGGAPGGPLSPINGNRLPLMTPSMPAFTLGAFPQTPPLYPSSFFSPGLGPFSPGGQVPLGMGSPYFGPTGGAYMGAGLNAAPGAPVHRPMPADYNPMFPMTASYDQQQYHQHQHNDAHQQQQQQQHEAISGEDERTPPANGQATDSPSSAAVEPSYFPPVFASSSSASSSATPSPPVSAPSSVSGHASSAPISPSQSISHGLNNTKGTTARPDLPQHSHSADAVVPHKALAALKMDAAAASAGGAGWASDLGAVAGGGGGLNAGPGGVTVERRRSFVPGATAAGDIRRRFEGEEGGGSVVVGGAGGGGGGGGGVGGQDSLLARRASMEEGSRTRPKFGTSIWGL